MKPNALASYKRNALMEAQDPSVAWGTPRKRNALEQMEVGLQGLGMVGIPGVSDVAGLAGDAMMFSRDPESRTPMNFGLSALGALPFVPAIGMVSKKGKGLGDAVDKYGVSHRPMQDAGGAARLHDLTAAMPDDVYGPNALQYYGSGDPRESAVLRQLKALRGKPDAEVTIYRGVPSDASAINAGDWVTLDKSVAEDYANLEGGRVLEMKVRADDVTAWGDSLLEFGYYPKAQK